jgi:hypothetical protein
MTSAIVCGDAADGRLAPHHMPWFYGIWWGARWVGSNTAPRNLPARGLGSTPEVRDPELL